MDAVAPTAFSANTGYSLPLRLDHRGSRPIVPDAVYAQENRWNSSILYDLFGQDSDRIRMVDSDWMRTVSTRDSVGYMPQLTD